MRTIENNGETVWCFTKAELLALAAFVSKDETRTHINSLCLDATNVSAVATDGHTLARCQGSGHRSDKMSLLPLDFVQKVAKAITKGGEARFAANCTKVVATIHEMHKYNGMPVDEPSATLEGKLVDAKFPPYEQVIPGPNDNRAEKVGVSAEYLGRLQLVAKACECQGVTLYPLTAELDPIKAYAHSANQGTDWTVVIMPMRI